MLLKCDMACRSLSGLTSEAHFSLCFVHSQSPDRETQANAGVIRREEWGEEPRLDPFWNTVFAISNDGDRFSLFAINMDSHHTCDSVLG